MKFPTITLAIALATAMAAPSFAADEKASEKNRVQLKKKPYPMTVCIVSEEKLGSMGDPVVFVEGDQEIQLCCEGCRKDFTKNKAEHLKTIETAWKKVKAYPLTTCIASDEPIDPETAVGVVHEGREFIFCCKSCARKLAKNSEEFVKKFDEAAARKKS